MKRVFLFAAALLLLAGCGAPPVQEAPQPGEINIDYPQFPEYSAEINALIKEAAYRALDSYDLEPEECLILDIGYEVKWKTDKLISIVFEGMGAVPPRSRPDRFLYSLNIFAETGEMVTLADMELTDTALDAMYDAAEETLDPETYELFKRDYIDCVYEDGYGFLDELIAADAYFTPDTIGVVLPWKLSVGHWYIIEIPSQNTFIEEQIGIHH